MQKVTSFGSIEELLGKHVHLTGPGRYLYLEFDYALRTRKQILALTLKETSRKIVPQSLLDLKRKTVFPKGQKVISIYSKHLQTSELFFIIQKIGLHIFCGIKIYFYHFKENAVLARSLLL